MEIDPEDSDAVFWLRHNTKVESDTPAALAALNALRARHGDTAALAFNCGLCLSELDEPAAAHAAFRTSLAAPDAPAKLGAFIVDGAEFFLKTSVGAIPEDAATVILPVARYFNVDQRARFLTYLLSRDASRATFDLFWAVFDISPLPAFTSPPAAGITRLLFARCSAHGAEDRFATALSDSRLSMLREGDDLTLIELFHGDTQEPGQWLASLREVSQRTMLGNRDANDLSLIAMSTHDDDRARPIIEALAAQSRQNWGVMRVLGVMAERAGHRDDAMAAYDRAARCELEVRGIDVPPAASDGSPSRISGIALSFNDAPLVPHFCRMIAAHCDELVVNDGGSSDDTIAAFRRYSAETGFPIHVIEDVQHGNRERTIFNKEGYRDRNLGGVLAFDADRRRTTTIVQAEGDYLLMLDLDDYLPPFPNMKTLVQASPYVDHFAGARLEVIGNGHYTALHLGPNQACPTLYRRHRKHVYAGVNGGDEYLARIDLGIAKWAMMEPHVFVTDCYNYWHLKHVLDGRSLPLVRPSMGPSHRIKKRWDRPLSSALPAQVKM